MRINLLENQIELILKALQKYNDPYIDKQLKYATYESLQAQLVQKNIEKNKKSYKKVLTIGNTYGII